MQIRKPTEKELALIAKARQNREAREARLEALRDKLKWRSQLLELLRSRLL